MSLREFREVGFASAQVDRIARNAGVARGTFYFHFPTKHDVMLELARRITTRILRRVDMIVEAKPSLRDFLLRLSDALIDEHARVSEAGLNAEVLALYLRRPEELRESPRAVPTLSHVLARQLQRNLDEGELQTQLPVADLATMIMSSLLGVLARMPPGEQVRQTCGTLIDLLVKGLQPNR